MDRMKRETVKGYTAQDLNAKCVHIRIRAYKDYQSNIDNGIEREITITAEDGREIFHYKGKIDVESDHTDNYIKFESEEGKRYLIYYGITDTIVIKES